VAYITTAERIGMKKGYEQGIQQGIQQGVQQGIQQGTLEGEKLLLTKLLSRRFADLSAAYIAKIKKANAEILLRWGNKAFDAKNIEDVFAE
jgi:flagellar biosynthesis/type III secretory pathway protein FliH